MIAALVALNTVCLKFIYSSFTETRHRIIAGLPMLSIIFVAFNISTTGKGKRSVYIFIPVMDTQASCAELPPRVNRTLFVVKIHEIPLPRLGEQQMRSCLTSVERPHKDASVSMSHCGMYVRQTGCILTQCCVPITTAN